MRILVVTIFNSLNYGAFLQGFGLYQFLQDKGHNVQMYIADSHDLKFYFHALHLRDTSNFFYNLRLLKSFYKSWTMMEQVNNLNQEYDLAIIGSDELWNVQNVNFQHTDIYIGKNIKAKKICTYAISGNNTTQPLFCKIYGKEPFKYIDTIAVRDYYTKVLVTDITDSSPVIVVDPTLLYNFKIKPTVKFTNYLVVYGYYFDKDEQEKILTFAKKKKFKLISAGFVHRWCDEIFTGTPLEFLSLIKNSNGVISATFHGTILSMKYNKQLAVFHHGSPKIVDALSRYQMEYCAITEKNTIEDCFQYSSDYNNFNKILKEAIDISIEYINKVLEDR